MQDGHNSAHHLAIIYLSPPFAAGVLAAAFGVAWVAGCAFVTAIHLPFRNRAATGRVGAFLVMMSLLLCHYNSNLRNRSALPMTETELKVIAALAMIGLRSRPKKG
jgi:hypothetical protein